MKKTYQHLFFDLDHTLWDFERSAEEAKQTLYERLELNRIGIPSYEAFREKYVPINTGLWALYREAKISKQFLNFNRFYLTLCEFGIEDESIGQAMASGFIEEIASNTYLFPYAIETLEYLSKKYPLYIITNGFEEVQFPKLKHSGLDKYFTSVITSEEAGSKKPDPTIFEYALKRTGALAADSLMIGDDLEVDIGGARAVGIDQLFVNHLKVAHNDQVTIEVSDLKEIQAYL
jgi:putative hydrolase of the HAD superfamily